MRDATYYAFKEAKPHIDQYLKGRMIHVSAPPVPVQDETGIRYIVMRHQGTTLNTGSNKAKRMRRTLKRVRRIEMRVRRNIERANKRLTAGQ